MAHKKNGQRETLRKEVVSLWLLQLVSPYLLSEYTEEVIWMCVSIALVLYGRAFCATTLFQIHSGIDNSRVFRDMHPRVSFCC